MKVKGIAIIALAILSLVADATYNNYKPNSNENKKNNHIIVDKKMNIEETDEEMEEVNNVSIIEEDSSEKSENSETLSEQKSYESTQNTTKEEKNNSYVQNNSSTPISSVSSTPPVTQTPWGALGISEYDYYNNPAPNEGELAFRESESKCDSVATLIANQYGFVTHFGDVYSYSESYIGCWITIHLPDGRRMFYNEFMSRVNRGEF